MEHKTFSASFTHVTKRFLIAETNLLLVTLAAFQWSKHLAGESDSRQDGDGFKMDQCQL